MNEMTEAEPVGTKGGAPESEQGVDAIEKLIADVQGLKPVFVGIVDFCRKQRRASEVNARFDELTAYNTSTMSPERVRMLLEEAGALAYIEGEPIPAPEGDDADEQQDECYRIVERTEGSWRATEAGLAYVDAIDPDSQLDALFAEEPELACEYEKVLEALLSGPLPIVELSELVDGDEAMRAAGKFAPYLVKKLEERGGIEFRGAWAISAAGENALARLVER